MPKRKLCEKPEQIMTYFDHVPDEILYEIVSMLSTFDLCRLAKVSQRLHRVCADERLWESVSLTKQIITFSDMEMLFRSSFPIKTLDLTASWIQKSNEFCQTASFHIQTLEKLNLTKYGTAEDPDGMNNNCEICDTFNGLWYILERCRTKELLLNLPGVQLNSTLMEAISKHGNLEVLSMEGSNFQRVPVSDFQKLYDGCSRLKECNLTGCRLSMQQLRAVCDHIPETIDKLVFTEVHTGISDIWRLLNVGNGTIDNNLVQSYGILFRRAKNLKYLGAPFEHLRLRAVMDGIIQHQNVEALRLFDHDLTQPSLYSVLGRVARKVRRIDIFTTESVMFDQTDREEIPAQVEELRKAFVGIDIEIFDGIFFFE